GYELDEVVGRKPGSILQGPGTDPETVRHMREAIARGEAFDVEVLNYAKDGREYWLHISAQPICDDHGTITNFIAIESDITDRKNYEAELARSRERFELVSRATKDVIWDLNLETRESWWSENLRESFGYEPKETFGDFEWCKDRIHPEDRERVTRNLNQALESGQRHWSDEYRFLRADGTYASLFARASIIRNQNNEPIRVVGAMVDLTEPKQAMEKIEFQKTLLECQSEASLDGILVVDNDRRVISYNRRFVEMWNVSSDALSTKNDEVLLKSVLDQVADPEDFVRRADEIYMQPEANVKDEIELRDGRVFDRYSSPVKSDDGIRYGRVWFFRDITDMKRYAEQLELQKLVVENSNTVLFRWKAAPGWPVELVSQNIRQFGYEAEQFLRNEIRYDEIIHPHDLERVAGEVMHHSEVGDSSFDQEYRIRCRDGSIRWVFDRTMIERDASGLVTHFQGTVIDITERKRAEEELRRSQRFLQSTLDALSAHIAIIDRTGTIIEVNRAWRNFADQNGLNLDGYGVGQNYLEAWTGDGPCSAEALEAANGTRRVLIGEQDEFQIEYPCHSPSEERWFMARATRFATEGAVYAVLAHENVTQIKSAERDLHLAKEAAEAANRAKSEFLANMSHEIRTPMASILGFSEMLLEEQTSDDDRIEYVSTIRRNADHLLAVINDILDISKIESGQMTVERVVCSPADLVSEVMSLLNVRAKEKSLELEVEYASPVPSTIHSDPTRLRQILLNLIGNAIKFTDEGAVRIVLSSETSEDDQLVLQFDIIDTGIGLSGEQILKLFRPFTQADTSTRRRFGGTGLGLAISKRLAEILGGTIEVDSTVGHGSRFSVRINCDKDEVGPMVDPSEINETRSEKGSSLSPAPSVQVTPGLRVLLAEDGQDNQRLIGQFLKMLGAIPTIAENGHRAYELAMSAQESGTPYDLIFMDMQMPVLDGYSATRRLRQAGYAGKILALTAHAMHGDREKCLRAGCDDYLTKPITRERLAKAMATWARTASLAEDG
ncbi:MAG: PAS domain S-box protein, partial [Phycisphaerales bacterium]